MQIKPRIAANKESYPAAGNNPKFLKTYRQKYLKAKGNKALAMLKNGRRWAWSKEITTLEMAKTKALKTCGKGCIIVDINGTVIGPKAFFSQKRPLTTQIPKNKKQTAKEQTNVKKNDQPILGPIAQMKASCLKSATKKLRNAAIAKTYCECTAKEITRLQKTNAKNITAPPQKLRKIIAACNAVASLDTTQNECNKKCGLKVTCLKSCQCIIDKIKTKRSIYQIEAFLTAINQGKQTTTALFEKYSNQCNVQKY